MRKGLIIIVILVIALAANAVSQDQCITLKNGIIQYSSGHYLGGQLIKPGFDEYGYNYQAHLFNGYYANAYLGGEGFPPYEGDDATYLARVAAEGLPNVEAKWYWPYRQDVIQMKWNDAWIANTDCDGDGKLDRHFGYGSYIGSGAWETNHQSGTYSLDGKEYHWTYFVKIVAVPADAAKIDGVWYSASGKEIGYDIWGEFAVIEEIYNDPGTGAHGVMYKSPARAGFGNWQ